VNATELRRLAARVNLLRAHVELESTCERDGSQREALEQVRALLVDGERVLIETAGKVAS
jgi:hypothetical protein